MRPRIVVVQPSVPTYRLDFFDRLYQVYGDDFKVYASLGDLGVLTSERPLRAWEVRLGTLCSILPGIYWQRGVLELPISKGDTVIVSGAPRCISNLVLLLKARICGAQTVWWGHYWSSTSRQWRFALRMWLARLSNALLFYTDQEVMKYRAGTGGHLQPAFALNNGIALDEVKRLRTPYSASDRGRSLAFIGRLTKKSELSLLLRSLVAPGLKDIRLAVIGAGEMLGSLQAEAAALNIDVRITWHGPITDERRISDVLNRCSLFVYPGAVGLSLIHTMAYGLPSIVHDDKCGHNPEIAAFESGVTGLAFRRGDVDDLARRINDALTDEQRMSYWSEAARLRVESSFNTAAMAERFLHMLLEVSRRQSSRD